MPHPSESNYFRALERGPGVQFLCTPAPKRTPALYASSGRQGAHTCTQVLRNRRYVTGSSRTRPGRQHRAPQVCVHRSEAPARGIAARFPRAATPRASGGGARNMCAARRAPPSPAPRRACTPTRTVAWRPCELRAHDAAAAAGRRADAPPFARARRRGTAGHGGARGRARAVHRPPPPHTHLARLLANRDRVCGCGGRMRGTSAFLRCK